MLRHMPEHSCCATAFKLSLTCDLTSAQQQPGLRHITHCWCPYNVLVMMQHRPASLALLQEPLCSLIFNPSAVRDGFPCCHAYYSCRDGCDLIVGIANGEGKQHLRIAQQHSSSLFAPLGSWASGAVAGYGSSWRNL